MKQSVRRKIRAWARSVPIVHKLGRKFQGLGELANQRRLDGTNSKTHNFLLKRVYRTVERTLEPFRLRGIKRHKDFATGEEVHFTRENIIKLRKKA